MPSPYKKATKYLATWSAFARMSSAMPVTNKFSLTNLSNRCHMDSALKGVKNVVMKACQDEVENVEPFLIKAFPKVFKDIEARSQSSQALKDILKVICRPRFTKNEE